MLTKEASGGVCLRIVLLTFTDSSLRSDELLRTDFVRKMTKHRKRKIKNQKSKNHGKTRDLETGDSDTHHHPYRHRHEHRGGELYVMKKTPPTRRCVKNKIRRGFFALLKETPRITRIYISNSYPTIP